MRFVERLEACRLSWLHIGVREPLLRVREYRRIRRMKKGSHNSRNGSRETVIEFVHSPNDK